MEFHFFVKNVITIKANPKYTYKKKNIFVIVTLFNYYYYDALPKRLLK